MSLRRPLRARPGTTRVGPDRVRTISDPTELRRPAAPCTVTGGAPDEAHRLELMAAASMPGDDVLRLLASDPDGLSGDEAARRLRSVGPNAVRSRHTGVAAVLLRQLRSPLLLLLGVTAAASFFVGERTNAVIIAVILCMSVGLGLLNEYRAESAAEALHDQIRHRVVAFRDGLPAAIDVVDLVPGDVVMLRLGEVVPADIRLLSVARLSCDESMLTGESVPVTKSTQPVTGGAALGDLTSCTLMGTVVHVGEGTGVVVATGKDAEFGRVTAALDERAPDTEFQIGLRRFSLLLVRVAAILMIAIFAINVSLHRPLIDALLFSLAIAVGVTPQLLPAVVSTSLAAGSRQLAHKRVLVKRLVCIEDLGDVDVLFTDKTGTLTDGRIQLVRTLTPDGSSSDEPLLLGLRCSEVAVSGDQILAGNPLDVALWESPAAQPLRHRATGSPVAVLPFDHDRQLVSVIVNDEDGGRKLITKGAPEQVLRRCPTVPPGAAEILDGEFTRGSRVVAVATRPAGSVTTLTAADEAGLSLRGFLVFVDPPKATARGALERLRGLGITVKVVTGDNPKVAARVCTELGLPVDRIVTGADLAEVANADLPALVREASVFARVSPDQKGDIVRAQRQSGIDVAFLGDGVNDAVALHAADVGISVDSATDVAKDAADVILLEKDLDVLADGVAEGRRVFANTLKYVLMGTSSNFGNMFSAAGASAILPFLPMLPSQILLNNLLYDSSQLAIPTDGVDEEQLARPSRWDIGFIRRFMLFFGPISSVFDFATFAIMVIVFHAGADLFRAGWFVESLATQTLVIFAIRTRRVPFIRSRPGTPLLLSALGVVAIGAVLPYTPAGRLIGFAAPPVVFFLALIGMVIAYLVLIEFAKHRFFRTAPGIDGTRTRRRGYRILRRAGRFTATRHSLSKRSLRIRSFASARGAVRRRR